MPLSDDQKAMLRLLSQRGEQGYEDIAALKGLSLDEVGEQVREAVAELEAEGIPAPAIPDPPGGSTRSPLASPSTVEPGPQSPTAEPKAPKPEKAPPRSEPKEPKARRSRPARPPKLSLPSGRGPRAALAAGVGAVIVVVVILLVSGGGGSDSATSGEATSGQAATGAIATAVRQAEKESPGNSPLTKALLQPVEGGEGTGVAIFGKLKKALALEVFAEGLEQTSPGESYTVWLSDGPEKMLPLASTEVTEKGVINAQVEVPLEILAYLAAETFDEIAITRTSEAKLKASIKTAGEKKESPSYTGTEVLRGTVTGPIVGAQQEIEEKEAEGKKKE